MTGSGSTRILKGGGGGMVIEKRGEGLYIKVEK